MLDEVILTWLAVRGEPVGGVGDVLRVCERGREVFTAVAPVRRTGTIPHCIHILVE